MPEVQSLLDAMRDTIHVGDYLLNNETQVVVRVEALDNTGDLKKVYFTDKRNAIRSVRLDRIHFDHKIRHRNYNWLGPAFMHEEAKPLVLIKTNAMTSPTVSTVST